jgi:hypothetical protein
MQAGSIYAKKYFDKIGQVHCQRFTFLKPMETSNLEASVKMGPRRL